MARVGHPAPLTALEPDDSQLEVALEALKAVLAQEDPLPDAQLAGTPRLRRVPALGSSQNQWSVGCPRRTFFGRNQFQRLV